MGLGLGNSNYIPDPAIWSPPHRPCPGSQPGTRGLQNPSETLSFRWLAGNSACRRGTSLMPGTAASAFGLHRVTSLPANPRLPRLSTHSPLCHRHRLVSLSTPGARCAQGLPAWGGMGGGSGRRGKATRARGTSSLYPPSNPRFSSITHMMLESQECNRSRPLSVGM